VSALELSITPEIVATTDDKVGSIVSKMREIRQWVVPIIKNGRYVGIFSYKDLLSKKVSPEAKILNVVKPSTIISPKDDISRIVAKFYTTKARALPIVDDNKKLLGMVTRESLLQYLLNQNKIPPSKAREFMSSPAIMVNSDDSVARARWIMVRDNITRLPVLENNRLVGIVTMKDIVDRLYSVSSRKKSSILREEERIMALPVKEIMSYPVYSFRPTEDLINITSSLLKHRISGAPLIEGESVVGIISTIDVIKAVAKQFEISMPIEAKLTQDLRKPELKSTIDGVLDRYVARLERITEIIRFNVSFKEEAGGQGNKIYTVTAKAVTKIGSFVAKESDWDPVVAVKKAVDILEERILKALKKIQEAKKKGTKEE